MMIRIAAVDDEMHVLERFERTLSGINWRWITYYEVQTEKAGLYMKAYHKEL